LTEGLKNLIEVPRQEQAQREGTTQTPDIKGKIVEYLWHLKREGRKEHTIISHRKVLSRLAKHGANLLDPESVKDVIANEQVQVNSKYHYVNVYTVFAEWLNLPWKPPIYKSIRKIPWIPSEGELDQLIAGFKRKTVVYLMILKETMARSGEIWALKWTDLNGNVLAINAPEKNSNSRQFKLSDRLVSLLNSLAKKDQRIFGPATNLNNFRGNFSKRRKYLATKLGNPRLNQITFHTFRHWGATMLYHKTKDILYVKQQLGHRCIENTMVYTQLISFENDEFHTSFARTLEEEDKLLKAGFEFVRYSDKEEVAIYRKRK
jgi:integrase